MTVSYIFSILKTSILVFLFNDYLKRNYPDNYQETIVNISFQTIHLFSVGQIWFNKFNVEINNLCKKIVLNNRLSELIDNYRTITRKNNIEFIHNDTVIYSINKQNMNEENVLNLISSLKYDFLIYSDYLKNTDDTIIINKKIIYQFPIEEKVFEYVESKVKFISSEIIVNGKTELIYFKNKIYNYLISGNIIDLKFITYFLKTHYENFYKECINTKLCISNVKLNIIDNDANLIEFDSENILKICETGYDKINSWEET